MPGARREAHSAQECALAWGRETGYLGRNHRFGWRNSGVRFVLILALIALAALVGLFVYGQMLEPETTTIEVEADYGDE